jgi:PAS domain S-box-containing protein
VREHERLALSRHRIDRALAARLRRLSAERQRFESLVEGCSDFVAIADPDRRLRYLNAAGRRLVGLSPTFDVTTTRMADYYPADRREQLERAVLRALETEGCHAGREVLRHWQTGAEIPVASHHVLLREPGTSRLLGVGAILHDVSEERRCAEERERLLADAESARAEALRASRAKDDFLALLGHELRNPLAPILTALEVMKLRGQRSREQD